MCCINSSLILQKFFKIFGIHSNLKSSHWFLLIKRGLFRQQPLLWKNDGFFNFTRIIRTQPQRLESAEKITRNPQWESAGNWPQFDGENSKHVRQIAWQLPFLPFNSRLFKSRIFRTSCCPVHRGIPLTPYLTGQLLCYKIGQIMSGLKSVATILKGRMYCCIMNSLLIGYPFKMEKLMKNLFLAASGLAFLSILSLPSFSLAYDHLLRDPKTHMDCNNAKHMLRMAGPDTHSHVVRDIRRILKRCDAEQKKADLAKKKDSSY